MFCTMGLLKLRSKKLTEECYRYRNKNVYLYKVYNYQNLSHKKLSIHTKTLQVLYNLTT